MAVSGPLDQPDSTGAAPPAIDNGSYRTERCIYGLAESSHADKLVIQTLRAALALIDVSVLDHFIAPARGIFSFTERGLP